MVCFFFLPYFVNFRYAGTHRYNSRLSLIDVRHLVKLKDLIDKFKKIKTLYENNPLNNEENKLLITHLEGIILGPIIVQLSINKWIDVNTGGKIKFSRQLSQQCQNILIDCCITTNLIEKNNKLTEKGNFFFKRSTAYGVTVSYMPLFSQMNKKGLSGTTIQHVHTATKSAFKFGVERGLIKSNPLVLVQ